MVTKDGFQFEGDDPRSDLMKPPEEAVPRKAWEIWRIRWQFFGLRDYLARLRLRTGGYPKAFGLGAIPMVHLTVLGTVLCLGVLDIRIRDYKYPTTALTYPNKHLLQSTTHQRTAL